MKRAERMIRYKIDELSIDRIAPKKQYIEQAIEFMYLQGAISKRKQVKLSLELDNKYTQVLNKYYDEQKIKSDIAFEQYLKSFDR
ncbi:MAG: hypothetical protein K0S01_2443 [Herbinix sp.]|jgi:hypothetical protein|nr:hypothetical protein [Herbinix sp.]